MSISKTKHLYSLLGASPIQTVSLLQKPLKSIRVDIKRDDLIHPVISGNKWRKIKYLLLELESRGITKLSTMGGRYSNFLHCIAYIGNQLGWNVEVKVLGYPEQPETPMLSDIKKWGSKVTLVNKQQFRELRLRSLEINGTEAWLPEGGCQEFVLKGVAETFYELSNQYDYIVSASATGATLAGYGFGVQQQKFSTKVLGIAVLKNDDAIIKQVEQLIGEGSGVVVVKGHELGGYAKVNKELTQYIEHFYQINKVPLEPIYSGKAMMALEKLITEGYFPAGSNILFVHCGGLQGIRKE